MYKGIHVEERMEEATPNWGIFQQTLQQDPSNTENSSKERKKENEGISISSVKSNTSWLGKYKTPPPIPQYLQPLILAPWFLAA
jgi:hypothetical protein